MIFRVAYVTQSQAESGELTTAWDSVNPRYAHVGMKLQSPDGLPSQSLLLFTWRTSLQISYNVNGRGFHGIEANEYTSAAPAQSMLWETEMHQGRLGYFLIGMPRQSNLWRTVRVETDYANRFVFTVVPIEMSNGLPPPRFERIEDPELRAELAHHWNDLENALDHHSYRALVTCIKNVAEGLLYFGLGKQPERKRVDMGNMLPMLKRMLEGKLPTKLPFTELDYHLLSKLRLLHQRTHVERGMSTPLRPDLALSATHDLAEILRSVGLAE